MYLQLERVKFMKYTLISMFIAISSTSAAWSEQIQSVVLFISPKGSDNNSGTSTDAPFASLQRGEQEITKSGAGTAYLMDGTFLMPTPLLINGSALWQRWLALPGSKPKLDGGGTASTAIIVSSKNVIVDGLTITNFRDHGILVRDAGNVVISNNWIEEIKSTRWSQAGIMILENAPHVTVSGNSLKGMGQGGIEFFASAAGNISRPLIVGNLLIGTCRAVVDCGAIYVGGRSQSSDHAIIRNNRIIDYGPQDRETKAIYLDDFLSSALVTENEISGSGTYPLEIHGGRNNIITKNTINPGSQKALILYYRKSGPRASRMDGNIVSNNTFSWHDSKKRGRECCRRSKPTDNERQRV